MPDFPVNPEAFPTSTRTAAGDVDGIHTDVMVLRFADKIMVTISQGGRLAHWVHVPLDHPTADPTSTAAPPTSFEDDADPEDPAANLDLLPMAHLTATTVLGGTMPERDTAGQLVATQVASAIATKDPEERRLVVVGMGLEKKDMSREAFVDVVGLVMGCL
ncbi:putative an15g01155 proteasome assembly chaperone 3 protein [Neofusicoccum parvum]|uniref:An15g01155 proteasome assembly chaperone 3 protein n=2 Tax=Neofusicoccum parvum TaxID=310453 RepID=A0ACB5S9V7_9PEZI|nr:putative an15g01155 proteasome assembly chaperone 3 protein [Neofusicoccum parvum UCRNP2]GME32086.1 putative an15g01155 proteasome assembly chaperone 3 protein [Neofusicoccum parvum]GME59473.1 putative an15g01155 proteasome assembly chaperone 3 protein [Neofusicoccum parvum]